MEIASPTTGFMGKFKTSSSYMKAVDGLNAELRHLLIANDTKALKELEIWKLLSHPPGWKIMKKKLVFNFD